MRAGATMEAWLTRGTRRRAATSAAFVRKLVAAFAGPFGLVHRAVGLLEQFVGGPFPRGAGAAARDADACSDPQPVRGEHVDLADRLRDRFGDRDRVGLGADNFHEDDELVPAHPR